MNPIHRLADWLTAHPLALLPTMAPLCAAILLGCFSLAGCVHLPDDPDSPANQARAQAQEEAWDKEELQP